MILNIGKYKSKGWKWPQVRVHTKTENTKGIEIEQGLGRIQAMFFRITILSLSST